MLQGRILCKISLLIIAVIMLSTYGPRDFLGLNNKVNAAEVFLVDAYQVEAQGVIYRKEIKNDKTLYYVKNATAKSNEGILSNTSFIFKSNSDYIPLNSYISINGIVSPFSTARNDGQFDAKKYYNSLGVYFQIDNVEIFECKNSWFSLELFYQLNKELVNSFSKCMNQEDAGVLSSVVIGNKSILDKEIQNNFQVAGIAHILAVSGLHISVICMALYRLLRRFGIRFSYSAIAAGLISILYGVLTGGSISSIRAIGMFLIFLVAQVFGESYDMITAVSFIACVLLIQNPCYAGNISFILSFGAVMGIWLIALPCNRLFKSYWREYIRIRNTKNGFAQKEVKGMKVLTYLFNSLVFSFGINVAMLPITTACFNQIQMYSIIINLLILPMMPLLLCIGFVGGVVGLVSVGAGVILLVPCHFIINYMEQVAGAFNKIPNSLVFVSDKETIFILVYYLLIIGFLKVIKIHVNDLEELAPKKRLSMKRKWMLGFFALTLTLNIIWIFPRSGSFEIDFLDVGQGDGIYINSGDGVRFFIDGGSTSEKEVGKYTLLPFFKAKGINKIDYWFVSHTDEDHVSGLIELLESGYKVKNIVFTDCIPQEDNEAFGKITGLAENSGSRILYMKQGDIIGSKHLSFKCVYPGASVAGLYADDVNALSLSLLMGYDRNCDGVSEYTAFFGGDIAAEQEQIIASSGLVGNVNLLKVSHHGSRFSSDTAFLQVLSPDVAIISCAKKNRYGHPADEAVERLKSIDSSIFYTMISGRVRVDEHGVDLYLE